MEAIGIELSNSNPQKIGETELIKRILAGEKELYEILVRRNNQKLYRVIRTYLKIEAEIEDVMQNSYIKAYSKLHQFKLNASFSTWLTRIAINEALARLNEKGKIYNLRGDNKDLSKPLILEIPDSGELNPQDKMIRNESKVLLENAIDRLEVKYKAVYIMKEVEEMSIKEISDALDITASNVKVRLHRAKSMLKEYLYEISSDKNVFEFGFSRCDRITENVMSQI